ncbi:transmembrane protein 234 [Periophthalmus magnuspinnatus]|uniref:transmembrane protein 234 n=1 Tax=Periophthalmus magnuspinnatus TaxID=409849 RepID=UPI00145BB050|nr:transmembrane protein 234 [Periophthalmus magnuspinnatus]
MVSVVELLSLVLVSMLWGCTNPLLKRGSRGIETVAQPNRVAQVLAELKFLLLNLSYIVPFLLNQSGSLVYYYTLSTTELSLAVPVTNSLTFLCTLITGKLLGEEFGGKYAVAGMFLTMAGITLCVMSSMDPSKQSKTKV